MRIFIAFLLCLSVSEIVMSMSVDEKLQKVIEIYGLEKRQCLNNLQNVDDKLVDAGKLLFELKGMSGESDTSCSTCHIEEKFLTDGLPVSVGVGGQGEGDHRMADGNGIIVARNSFALVGRADKDYSAYFWDGKIEVGDGGNVVSPFGVHIDKKFSSVLAVAAIQPILARDEFLGRVNFFSENEHVDKINYEYYDGRYLAASNLLREKFLVSGDPDVREASSKLVEAGVDLNELTLADIGNAIASFIAIEKTCSKNAWSEYVGGTVNAISEKQKEGALLFYGKARCAGCHTGNLFSDFRYHSIGVPQGGFGVHALASDLGRADVTNQAVDRYKFRTPPLLGVSKTAPYGHNGQFETMEDVVLFHLNPIPFLAEYQWATERERLQYGKILSQRDVALSYHDLFSNSELTALIEFLRSL